MKKKLWLLLLPLAITFSYEKINAQDIHFSQFWMAPLLQNPSLAGALYDKQGILNYKNQWGSVASPYKTINASYDMTFFKKRNKQGFWGAGLNVFSDKAGDSEMGTLQANLNIAYHIKLDKKNTLGAGLMGGFAQRSISFGALQWGSQYDGNNFDSGLPTGEPQGSESITFIDGGAGIVWSFAKGEDYMTANDRIKINVGAAVFHLHEPRYSFYNRSERLHAKWVAHGNFLYGIRNTDLSIVPGFMYYRQESAQEILVGSLFRYIIRESAKYTGFISGSALSVGFHMRTEDAAIVSAFIEKGLYTFGICYDLNTSDLKTASDMRGGIEISLRYAAPGPFAARSSYKY